MITVTAPSNQLLGDKSGPVALPHWQTLLAQAITDPKELLEVLHISEDWLPAARDAARQFPLRVPRSFVARMQRGNPHDPLLLQVLPLGLELQDTPGFVNDPVGDLASKVAAGMLQKYQGRALLIATGACAVHCRYCFRRHFPYSDELASSDQWSAALDAIRTDSSIDEIILSGGDPLTLNDRRLMQLTQALHGIPHVKRLRIHTRQPVVLPERVDSGLLEWLNSVRLQKVVVIHANHPQELDASVTSACMRLRDAGVTLLNQSVLLKGINDSPGVLAELSELLFAAGVLPYYLHLLDRVQGAAHFDVDEQVAAELMRKLLTRLPGYLVPRLVREVPGHASKTPVALW
jgi:EF-P beta-lysylation protein EpmB